MKKMLIRLLPLVLALVLVVGLMPALALSADAGGASTTGSLYVADAWMWYEMSIDSLTVTINGESENHDADCGALLYSVTPLSLNNYRVSFQITYYDNGYMRTSSTFSMDLQLSGDCRNGRSVSIGETTKSVGNTHYRFTGTFGHSSREVHGGGEATCVSDALCAVCGMKYADKNPDNHQWSWVGNDSTHSRTCSRTGCGASVSGDHTTEGGSAATCKKAAVCGICQLSYGATLSHNYSYSVSGKTITESCDKGCGHNSQTTLMKDETVPTTYTGDPIKGLKTEVVGSTPLKTSAITYLGDNVNVGNVTGSITINGLTVEETFEITRAIITTEQLAENYTGTYDGQAHGIDTSNLPAGSTVYYKDSETGGYSTDPVTRTDAGTTKVWYKVTNPNYEDKEETATITINPASISGATGRIHPADSATYNGSAHVPTSVTVTLDPFERLVEGTDYTLSWDKEGFIYPGVYSLTISGKGNFKDQRIERYSIRSAGLTAVTVEQTNVPTYDGNPHIPEVTASATTVDGAAVTFTYSTAPDDTYGEMPAFTEAGEHTVFFTASAPNHETYKGSFIAKISKAEPSFTHPAPKPGLVYDGTEKSLVTVTNTGTNEGEYVYRLDEESTWKNDVTGKDAGDYTVYWQFIPEDSNYATVEGSVPVTVAKAEPKAEDFLFQAAANLTYNGEWKTASVTAKTGVEGMGEIVGVMYYDAATRFEKQPISAGNYFVQINVDEGKNYTAKSFFGGADWVFAISKAQPVIVWETTELTYNGAAQGEAKVTLADGGSYSGTVTYSYGVSADSAMRGLPTNAGTYVVSAYIAAQSNYAAAENQTTITINPKAVTPTVTLTPDSYTYDGKAKEPDVKAMDGETEIAPYEYTLTYENTTEVGAGTVKVADAEGGNYTITEVKAVYLILPDASELEGVTTDNVKSSHQTDIDEIQAAMAGKDITGASTIATGKWRALADRCARLEAKIADVATKSSEITDGTDALPDQPETSDLPAVEQLLDKYEAIEDNLTAAEKEALADEIEELEDLRAAMTLTNTNLKEVTDGAAALKKDELDFADKATIKDLLEKAEDLESNPYLTDDQVQELADAEDKLKNLEAEYAAAEKVEADHLNKLPTTATPQTESAIKAYTEAKEAYDKLSAADKAKVDPAAKKKLDDLKTKLTDYKITKGNKGTWKKGSSSGLSFTANGLYSKFTEVKVDGKVVDSKNYTSKSGSTIVTLKSSYLKNLKNGKHTIAINFGGDLGGSATGEFTVKPATVTPDTADSSNIFIWSCVAMTSLLGLGAMLALGYKKKYRR